MRLSPGQWLICIMFGFASLLFATIIFWQMGSSGTSQRRELSEEEIQRREQEMAEANQNMPMKREDTGVVEPRAWSVAEVADTVGDEETVLGIEVDGKYRAYLASGMSEATSRHIVHDQLAGKPITMTFCDRNRCSRAFVRQNVKPDNFMMGGWSGEEMWLLINNRRYLHSSEKVPMEEYPIEVTTWGKWKAAHPDTDIYVGP